MYLKFNIRAKTLGFGLYINQPYSNVVYKFAKDRYVNRGSYYCTIDIST